MSCYATMVHGRHRVRIVVSLTAFALVLAACSSDGDDDRASSGRSTTTTSTTTTNAPASSSTTRSSPGTTAHPKTSQPPSTLPFTADTNPDTSNTVEGYPVLVSVRQGDHDGYRRYVFTFHHADPEGRQPWRKYARPAWDVRYVPSSEAVSDGSGEPVANAGAKAHLRIGFQADMHYADGRSALEESVPDEPPDLVFGGDFENRVTWFYGAKAERPFRVIWVGDGRLAVDIVR